MALFVCGCFQNDGTASMAVKGLNPLSSHIDQAVFLSLTLPRYAVRIIGAYSRDHTLEITAQGTLKVISMISNCRTKYT